MASEVTLQPLGSDDLGLFWRKLWIRIAAQGLLIVAAVFVSYEVFERTALVGASPSVVHALHLLRGAGTAFLLGTWAFLNIRHARIACDARVEESLRHLEARVHERTRELEEARAFTELLFNSLRERVIVLDGAGNVVKANRAAEDSAAGPLTGHRCLDMFPACRAAGDCFACRAAGSPSDIVETRADAAGRLWELEAIRVPGALGSSGVVIEVGRDVTERRNLEAQVRHQEKMASLGLLAAGFAHDIGNPLASLSTELELLEGEDDVARLRDSLGVLRNHVARMSRTLREMVDFARRRREEVTDVSIASVVSDSTRLLRHDPRWKRLDLVIDVPPDIAPVRMVEDHLVLVFVNLMINAADAMPEGGTIRVSARQHDGEVDVRVSDTGAGMTPEVLARAATPLFTTKPGGRGTGLGLSVSTNVVRAVGGTLDLTSAPGAGTEVRVRLPAGGGHHG